MPSSAPCRPGVISTHKLPELRAQRSLLDSSAPLMVPRGQFLIIDAASKRRPLPGDLLVCSFALSLLMRSAATKTQANPPVRPRSPEWIRLCRLRAGQNYLPRWSHSATSRSSSSLAALLEKATLQVPQPINSLCWFLFTFGVSLFG